MERLLYDRSTRGDEYCDKCKPGDVRVADVWVRELRNNVRVLEPWECE